MKKSLRAIAIGTTVAAAFSAGVFAEDIYQTVSAYLVDNVKVSIDGQEHSFITEAGELLHPLIYNNCVYLPLDYVISASGKILSYNADTKILDFSTPPPPPAPDPVMAYEIVSNENYVLSTSYGYTYLVGTVTVKNTGTTNLYLDSATFDIEDASGKLVDSSKYISGYPQILLPGETGVYYSEYNTDKINAKETYNIAPTTQISETDLIAIRCPVTEVTITDAKWGGIDIVGRVENTTGEDQSYMTFAVVLYDADGDVLCVEHGYTDAIAAGAKLGISTRTSSNLKIKAKDVASYDIYVYPYQYDWNF